MFMNYNLLKATNFRLRKCLINDGLCWTNGDLFWSFSYRAQIYSQQRFMAKVLLISCFKVFHYFGRSKTNYVNELHLVLTIAARVSSYEH